MTMMMTVKGLATGLAIGTLGYFAVIGAATLVGNLRTGEGTYADTHAPAGFTDVPCGKGRVSGGTEAKRNSTGNGDLFVGGKTEAKCDLGQPEYLGPVKPGANGDLSYGNGPSTGGDLHGPSKYQPAVKTKSGATFYPDATQPVK